MITIQLMGGVENLLDKIIRRYFIRYDLPVKTYWSGLWLDSLMLVPVFTKVPSIHGAAPSIDGQNKVAVN